MSDKHKKRSFKDIVGKTCPYCGGKLKPGDKVVEMSDGTYWHYDCLLEEEQYYDSPENWGYDPD